jgi:dolichol-phosphate mannosyltransferase
MAGRQPAGLQGLLGFMPDSIQLSLSVVIPARNEADNLAELIPEIAIAVGNTAYEVVVVDDGSTDGTAAALDRLAAEGLPVRRVAHARSLGQSAALWSGVRAARGTIIVTLDGDGQNDPAPIPRFLASFDDPLVGLVAGQRVGRKATFAKSLGSRLANGIRGALLKDNTRDTGCGIKAFRREAYLRLPYFQTMHRFLPALFLGDGWRVVHIDVTDRARQHGTSNYGNLDRLLVGLPDLFGVWWLIRRRRKNPMSAEHPAP